MTKLKYDYANRNAQPIHDPIKPVQAPLFMELDVNDINIDPAYQREVNQYNVRKIASNFNPCMMRPISVNIRDGKFFCWDGQHRLLAYKRMGLKTIPAMVINELDEQSEAFYFAHQDDNCRILTGVQKWRASTVAGEETVVEINTICHRHGYTVARKVVDDSTFSCVSTLRKVYNQLGPMYFERLVVIIKNSFGYTHNATCANIVSGLAKFIQLYDGDPEVPTRVDYDRLYRVLSIAGAMGVLRASESYRVGYLGSNHADKRVCRAITDIYNNRLRKGLLVPIPV